MFFADELVRHPDKRQLIKIEKAHSSIYERSRIGLDCVS
jgi:hypothetical protein